MVASGGSLHSYVAQQIGTMKNKAFLEDNDVRASILRHAEEVRSAILSIFRLIHVIIFLFELSSFSFALGSQASYVRRLGLQENPAKANLSRENYST